MFSTGFVLFLSPKKTAYTMLTLLIILVWVVPIPILVSEIPQKIMASVSAEYLNPRSDPIPCSYTRPIVMPASFA